MKIIPAIDLLGGQAVRLLRGKRDQATVYSDEPWTLAGQFAADGAELIHVVDLDGAFAGAAAQQETFRRIVDSAGVPIQLGGGVRDRAGLEAAFEAGASRVVLGTAAIKSPDFARNACADFPDRIVIAVDAHDGKVAVEGWVETTTTTAAELATRAATWGACAVLYTDIARDGAHTGPNVEATAHLAREIGVPVIASGGISRLTDLSELDAAGIPMAVVGRALYDKHFTLKQAIAAC